MATRRERVVLSLQDDFTGPMVKAAAATELLNKRLGSLSGEAVESSKATRSASRDIDGVGKSARSSEKDIDKLSGRLRILAEVGAIVGPSLLPIGAVALPAITGLAAGLGFAAVGAGTAVLAFQGMGDALKAVNKAGLEPTTENLQAAQEAMASLSPDAQAFVRELRTLQPELQKLRDTAAAGLFPGLTEGLDGLLKAGPRVEAIISAVSTALGDIAGDAGTSLGGDRWAPFLDFIAEEAPQALADMAQAAGNTTHALAEMWMAFQPVNDNFSTWLVDVTADFDKWAQGLSGTNGFQEFIDYIETNGPRVAETLGALGNAVLQIVEAIAPLGGPSLQIIEAFADAIATIADSPIGTPLLGAVAAMSLLNRTMAVGASLSKTTFGGAGVSRLKGYAGGLLVVTTAQERATMTARELAAAQSANTAGLRRTALGAAGLALALSGVADKAGLNNTAMLSLLGPWGIAGGLLLDLKANGDEWSGSLRGIYEAAESGNLDALNASLAQTKMQLADLNSTDGGAGDFFGDLKDSIAGADWIRNVPVVGGWASAFGVGDSAEDNAEKAISLGELAAPIFKAVAGAQDEATAATKRHADATAADNAMVAASVEAAHKQSSAFVTLGADVDNAKVSLSDWIMQMNIQAAALTNFGTNAAAASKKGLKDGLIADLKELGPAGALRMKQLANATEAEIARANAAWLRGERAVGDYDAAAKRAARAKVLKVDATYAISAVQALKNLLNDLHDQTINIRVNKSTNATVGEAAANDKPRKKAPGGPIYGPGTATSDSIPAMLSNGEYVVRAAAVDRYGVGFFDQANQMKLAGGGSPKKPTINHLTTSEYANAFAGIDFDRDSTWTQVRKELADFAAQIRKTGGRTTHEFDVFADRLIKSSQALDRQRSKVEAATNAVENLRQVQSALADTIRSTFTTDVFGSGFGSGIGSEENIAAFGADTIAMHQNQAGLNQVRQDAQDAQAFARDIKALKGRGLTGSALTSLAQSGNLGRAESLLGLSDAELRQYTQAFASRDAAVGSAASSVANLAVGDQLRAANKYLAEQNRLLQAQVVATRNILNNEKSHALAVDVGIQTGKALNSTVKAGRDRA